MSLRVSLFCALIGFASACATTGNDRILFYRVKVQRGESLAQIAARFDTNWQAIVHDNELTAPSDVRAGMVIKVRPGPGGYLAGSETMKSERSEGSAKKRRGLFSRMFGDDDEDPKEKRSGLLFDGGAANNMSWPLRGKINSPYGKRNGRMHEGLDIDGNTGDKVMASAKGVVKVAERTSGYGKTVIVSHGDYSTLYAHLSSIDVSEGDIVDRGDVVGEVGESGHATGPHLHFEVRNAKNKAVNPMPFLTSRSSLYSSR